MGFKLTPPDHLFGKKKILSIPEIKARMISNPDICHFFLTLILNYPITHAELTREAKKIFTNSYNVKTTRYLEKLQGMGLIDSLTYRQIDFDSPSAVETKVIEKVDGIKVASNSSCEGVFLNRVFYFPTSLGTELIEFIAKKCGWGLERDG